MQDGIASPNPDYPQDINVVTGENIVSVHSKNLFNPDNTYIGKAWNGDTNSARAIAYVPVTVGQNYTISFQNTSAVDLILYNFSNTSFSFIFSVFFVFLFSNLNTLDIYIFFL